MSVLEGTTLQSQLLKEILSRCDDNKGVYVTQGTYGIGLMFSISKSKDSPITLMTLDNRGETGSELDCQVRNFFVKLVPLYDQISFQDLESFSKEPRWKRRGISYLNKEKNIKIFAHPVTSSITEEEIRVRSHDEGNVTIKHSDILGYDWEIHSKHKDMNASPVSFFKEECRIQVELYKASNNNLDSFIPPLYVSDIIDKNDMAVIDLMKRKFDHSNPISILSNFFDDMKLNLRNKYRKIGIIVMPSMPMPPVVSGWNILNRLLSSTNKMGAYFKIQKITKKEGKNYVLKKYDDITQDEDKRCLYYIVQIVCGMIDLLNKGFIHGDLHFSNTLINPNQIASTQCFDVDSNGNYVQNNSSPFMGKVFIIDYGTSKKVDVPIYSHMNSKEVFKQQIITILKTQGTHGFSPLHFHAFDWLPSLFLSRDTGYYVPDNIFEKNLDVMFDLVNEFREKREEYQRLVIDTMRSSSFFSDTIDKIRETNHDGRTGSVLQGPPLYELPPQMDMVGGSQIYGGRDSVATINRKIELSLGKGKTYIKSTRKSSPKSRENMNAALAKSIFAIKPSMIESIGNKMIENLNQGVKSVENINSYVETVDEKKTISKSISQSQSTKKKKHKGKTPKRHNKSVSKSSPSRS